MSEALPADSYDALVTAAGTYRAAVVVRLAGEAGLRTAEIPRVRPCDLGESPAAEGTFLLAVPAEGAAEPERAETEIDAADDAVPIDRETVVPASLAADLRRYAESEGLAAADPLVGVSPRRVQMLVRETAERAREHRDDPALSSVTPRTLRRTFARRLLVDRGVDPHVVREAGGWETLDALDAHLDPLDGEAIAAAVAGESGGEGDPDGGGRGRPTAERDGPADREEREPALTLVPAFEAAAEASDRETAFETVVDRIAEADRWREARIRRGSSAERPDDVDGDAPWLSVPVGHRETTYGTLWLLADGEPARPTERREAEALGRCLGWTVTAGRWRDLLHSDAVTEVEFHTAATDAFLAAASAALDCRIELESTVAVSGSASRWYLAVTGTGPQAVADAVDDADGVAELRVIETREDGCAVSARATGGSIVRALTGHGAAVREAVAEEGRVRVVADLPDGTDVRPIADDLRE
ncbi:bacterio-opsin activator domain-containing protein, partial [Halorubrum halodurans]